MKFFIAIFVLIWLLTLVVWFVVSRAVRTKDMDRMKNRLLGTASGKKKKAAKQGPTLFQEEDKETGQLVVRALGRWRYFEWAQQLLEQAGLKWRPARLAHACLGMALMVFAGLWYLGPGESRPFAPLLALAAGSLPLLYVFRARKKRLHNFEAQFPESLEFISRSMRAGHAFSVSLEMIHREFPDPLSGEFRRTFEEHNLGLPIETVLLKLSKRVPSMDVHFFVSAVLLQRRTGGNLAEILDKLASLIRERFKLRGKIRAISAHGRMTGMALTCIPGAVALMLFYVNPDYAKFFVTETVGRTMAAAAVGLQLIGYGVIKKIVSIEV